MSVFTSRVTQTVELPGIVVTIRKLAPRHLDAARKASQLEHIAFFKELGGAAFVRELQTMNDEAKAAIKDAQVEAIAPADPLESFHRETLLDKGIVSWVGEGDDFPKLSKEAIADIDEDAQKVLATAVLKLSKPSLFKTSEELESARKND